MAGDRQFLRPEEVSEIYRDNEQFIRKIIHFHLGDTPEVDDVFQSLFLRLLEKPIPNKELINYRPYLYKMITNNIVDEIRRARAYKKHTLEVSHIPYHKKYRDLSEELIQKEHISSVFTTIENHLPPQISKVLKLCYVGNRSNAEIANTMHLAKETANSYKKTGLRILRRILNRTPEIL